MKRRDWVLYGALLLITLVTCAFGLPQTGAVVGPGETVTNELVSTALPSSTPTTLPPLVVQPSPSSTEVQSKETPPTALPVTSPTPTATATITLTPTPTAFPFDTHAHLERYVYVDQMSQHMYIFENGQLLRDIPCSTGLPTDTTYTEAWEGAIGRYYGSFQAFGVFADEAWYLYPSLGSILVHSLPYTYQNGYKVYQDRDALGVRPASHGCIRVSPEDAEWFTSWNPEGVLMTINDPYLDYWSKQLATPTPSPTDE